MNKKSLAKKWGQKNAERKAGAKYFVRRKVLCALLLYLFAPIFLPASFAQSDFPIALNLDNAKRATPPLDANTTNIPAFVRGDDVELDVTLFTRGFLLATNRICQYTNLIVQIFQAQNDTNAPQMAQTNTYPTNFFTNLTAAGWLTNSYPTNFQVEFYWTGSSGATALNLLGQSSRYFWLRVFATGTNGVIATFCEGPIVVYDGPISQLAPPIQGGQGYLVVTNSVDSLVPADANFFINNSNLLNASVLASGFSGLAITNLAGLLSTNATNFAGSLSTNATNFAGLLSTNATNFAGLLGTNATNFAGLLSTNATNFSGLLSTNATNFAATLSANATNLAGLLSTNATNFAGILSTNATNYASSQAASALSSADIFSGLIGVTLTNWVGILSTNATNWASSIASSGFSGTALTNLLNAAGSNLTNLLNTVTLNLTNWAGILSTNSTNYAAGQATAAAGLAEAVAAAFAGILSTNATNFTGNLSTNATNYAASQATSAISASESYAALVGTTLTNWAGVLSTNGSNWASSLIVGSFSGTALTNLLQAAGSNLTNWAGVLSTNSTNFAGLLSTNATNFAGLLSTNATNYAASIGAAASNVFQFGNSTLSNIVANLTVNSLGQFTNAFLTYSNSGGYTLVNSGIAIQNGAKSLLFSNGNITFGGYLTNANNAGLDSQGNLTLGTLTNSADAWGIGAQGKATGIVVTSNSQTYVNGAWTKGDLPWIDKTHGYLTDSGISLYTVIYFPNGIPQSYASTATLDWSKGLVQSYSLASTGTITFANSADGQTLSVAVTASGAYTITWAADAGNTLKWPGGAAPAQTASKTDVYTFIRIGTTIYGTAVQNF